MNRFFDFLPFLVALLFVAGCSEAERRGADGADLPDFEQMLRNDYVEPYKTGDIDRWLEVFADDAVGMHNTLPALEGKQALRRFAETVHQTFDIRQLDVSVASVTRQGDWALVRGDFVAAFALKQGNADDAPRQGKYILLWERQQDGAWKIILDMGNSNTP